jgi:hypothetical protein
VISTTPADTTIASTTPAGPIPLTGTWFSRVGVKPYMLIESADRTPGTRAPSTTLPRLGLAA